MNKNIERFIRYAKIDTQADENTGVVFRMVGIAQQVCDGVRKEASHEGEECRCATDADKGVAVDLGDL